MISFLSFLFYLFLFIYFAWNWKLNEINVLWSLTLIWQILWEILGILNILILWNSLMFCLKNPFLLMTNWVGFCEFFLYYLILWFIEWIMKFMFVFVFVGLLLRRRFDTVVWLLWLVFVSELSWSIIFLLITKFVSSTLLLHKLLLFSISVCFVMQW